MVTVEYPRLLEDVERGDRVVLGDGAIVLTVAGVEPEGVDRPRRHGRPGPGPARGAPARGEGPPGLRRPTRTSPSPPASMGAEIDYLAVSFVRSADGSATPCAAVTGPDGPRLVAKIETPSAVAALPALLEEADAIMVARGDLGISCPLEDVPHLQKVDRPLVRRRGDARHHRHPDAGEHDHRADADAGRGVATWPTPSSTAPTR